MSPLVPVLLLAATPNVLTLEQAVQTAVDHQPGLRQAHASTDVALARADEARAPLLPQVQASAGYTRREGECAAVISGQCIGSSTGGPTGSNIFAGNVGATQLIWDFDQTLGKYRAAKETALSQEEAEKATRLQIILTARTAYFTARAAKDLVQVAREALENQDQHLRQTKGFVEVGRQPEIALATALTNKTNAQVQVITAENNYDVAKAQLNQAMGVEQSTDYEVGNETLPAVPSEDEGTEKLLGEALAARPEFMALEHQLESQRQLLSSARGGYFPSIGASTGLTDQGPALDKTFWNWTGGVTLTWNLFQGFLTPAQVREQDASIASLEAQRDAERLQVRLEVEQARLAVRAAKASLSAATEALVNADAQLRLAEGRFQTGVGNIIELSDSQVARTTAAGQKVQAEFNVSSARAQLLKALGRA